MANVIISFPNSGRTWLQAMTKQLGLDCYYTHQGSHHNSKHTIEQIIKYVEKYPNKFDNMNIVLLVRDPKDTIVSSYFQTIYRVGIPFNSISDFIRDPNHGIEKLIMFNLFWSNFNKTNLVVSYENLMGDTKLELNKILKFFNHYASNDEIKSSVFDNNFKNSREREINSNKNARIYKHTDKNNPESFKARKAVIGGYKDYMSDEDIDYCNSIIRKHNYESQISQKLH